MDVGCAVCAVWWSVDRWKDGCWEGARIQVPRIIMAAALSKHVVSPPLPVIYMLRWATVKFLRPDMGLMANGHTKDEGLLTGSDLRNGSGRGVLGETACF